MRRDERPCAVIGPAAPHPQHAPPAPLAPHVWAAGNISPRRTYQEDMTRIVIPSPGAGAAAKHDQPDVRYCEGPALVSQQPHRPQYAQHVQHAQLQSLQHAQHVQGQHAAPQQQQRYYPYPPVQPKAQERAYDAYARPEKYVQPAYAPEAYAYRTQPNQYYDPSARPRQIDQQHYQYPGQYYAQPAKYPTARHYEAARPYDAMPKQYDTPTLYGRPYEPYAKAPRPMYATVVEEPPKQSPYDHSKIAHYDHAKLAHYDQAKLAHYDQAKLAHYDHAKLAQYEQHAKLAPYEQHVKLAAYEQHAKLATYEQHAKLTYDPAHAAAYQYGTPDRVPPTYYDPPACHYPYATRQTYDQSWEAERLKCQYSPAHNPLTRIPTNFSPNVISPVQEDPKRTPGTPYQAYAAHCNVAAPPTFIRREHLHEQVYNRARMRPNIIEPIPTKPPSRPRADEKSTLNLKNFLETWNEEDEDPKLPVQTEPLHEENPQLYILNKSIIPEEELVNYKHIQKIDRLPNYIKDISKESPSPCVILDNKIISASLKQKSPLPLADASKPKIARVDYFGNEIIDVEAKISQSVIHKEVGCNFEIKPCSPLNGAKVQDIQNKQPSEKKSPIFNKHRKSDPVLAETSAYKFSAEKSTSLPMIHGSNAPESVLCKNVEVIAYSDSMTEYERKINRESRVCGSVFSSNIINNRTAIVDEATLPKPTDLRMSTEQNLRPNSQPNVIQTLERIHPNIIAKKLDEEFPNLSVSNEDQIGVILNMGNANSLNFDEKSIMPISEYFESADSKDCILDSINEVDRPDIKKDEICLDPLDNNLLKDIKDEVLNSPKEMPPFESQTVIFPNKPDESEVHIVNNSHVDKQLDTRTTDVISPIHKQVIVQNDNSLLADKVSEEVKSEPHPADESIAKVDLPECIERDDDQLEVKSETDPFVSVFPSAIESDVTNSREVVNECKEITPHKKGSLHGKIFFSKKLNRYEYSIENCAANLDEKSERPDNDEFVDPLLCGSVSEAQEQKINDVCISETVVIASYEAEKEASLFSIDNVDGEKSVANDVSVLDDEVPSANINLHCNDEKLFEIDIGSPANDEGNMNCETIAFLDENESQHLNLEEKTNEDDDKIMTLKAIDHTSESSSSCESFATNENTEMYASGDMSISTNLTGQYQTYLMEDSLEDDTYGNCGSVMLGGDPNTDLSADEESTSSQSADRLENSNLDVNGLEIGGCWIDDIACVETVVAEENNNEKPMESEEPDLWKPFITDKYRSSFADDKNDEMDDINSNIVQDVYDDSDYSNGSNYPESPKSEESRKSDSEKVELSEDTKSYKRESEDSVNDESFKRIYAELERMSDGNPEPKIAEKPKAKNDYKKRDRVKKYDKGSSESRMSTSYGCVKTKGAKKYIPASEESKKKLKCHLPVREEILLSLKKPSVEKNNEDGPTLHRSANRMVLPKKPPKPLFEDVLKNIDETIKMKLKKAKNMKAKVVPKMIIKKNEHGSHYASVSKKDNQKPKEEVWQPRVNLQRSASIDDLIKDKNVIC